MSYTIEFNSAKKVIIGRVSGVLTIKLLREYTLEVEKFIKKEKSRLILGDYRAAKLPFSTLDVYNLPDEHKIFLHSLGSNIFGYKRALLFDIKYLDLANFFEDVAVNRGQKVKVFQGEPEAINWLLTN